MYYYNTVELESKLGIPRILGCGLQKDEFLQGF